MSQDRNPGFEDANLILKLYEMRREDVMRKSRDAISFGFWPQTFDDVTAIMDFSHQDNAAWRQVVSYWEMVFGFGHNGIVEPEFLVENSGEGVLLYMKVRAFLDRLRVDSPTAFQHIEWAATQTDTGKQRVEFFEKRFGEKFAGVQAAE